MVDCKRLEGVIKVLLFMVILVGCFIALWGFAESRLIINGKVYSDVGVVDASMVLNPFWLNLTDQRYNDTAYVDGLFSGFMYNESDPIFSAENGTIWSAINGKLDSSDQRFNDTIFASGLVSVESSGRISNDSALSGRIDSVNASALKIVGNQSLNGSFSVLGNRLDVNGGWLNPFGTSFINGDLWTDGSIFLTGNISSVNVGEIYLNGSWIPVLDNVFNVGNVSNRWKGVYGVDVFADNFYGFLNASYITNPFWITGSGTANATFNAIPMFDSSKNIVDSPISFHSNNRNYLSVWDRILYVDGTYGSAGVNMPTPATFDASFKVFAKMMNGSGSLNFSSYDGVEDQSLINIVGASGIASLTDATIVYYGVSNTSLYINYMNNATSFFASGNRSGLNTNVWHYKPAPYIDVSGSSDSERGYSISNDGDWQWAWYIPDNVNDSELCFANSKYPTRDLMCLDSDGNLNTFGQINANVVYGEIYYASANYTPFTVTLTLQNVFYPITNLASGLNNNCYLNTSNNFTMYCDVSGIYSLNFGVYSANNGADQDITFAIFVNNISIDKALSRRQYTQNNIMYAGNIFYLNYTAYQPIQIYARNDKSAGKILSIYNLNLNVRRLS